TWTHSYDKATTTPLGEGTTIVDSHAYSFTDHDPYYIPIDNVSTTVDSNGGIDITRIIDDHSLLIGADTHVYTSDGSRTVQPDGTFSSTMVNSHTATIFNTLTTDTYHSFSRDDASVPGSFSHLGSTVKAHTSRIYDYSLTVSSTTIRNLDESVDFT